MPGESKRLEEKELGLGFEGRGGQEEGEEEGRVDVIGFFGGWRERERDWE